LEAFKAKVASNGVYCGTKITAFTATAVKIAQKEMFLAGVSTLIDVINNSAPVYAQIVRNREDYWVRSRRAIAIKIIGFFSGINAAISAALPLVDIVITTFTMDLMISLLSSFSSSEKKNIETYKTVHQAAITAATVARVAVMVVGGVLQFSIIGFAIGAAVGGSVSGGVTGSLGAHAYNYFVVE